MCDERINNYLIKPMLNKSTRENFSFSRQERRGIVVLCSLIILSWVVPSLIRHFKKDQVEDAADFEKEVDFFNNQQVAEKAVNKPIKEKAAIYDVNRLPDPFPFDPNTLSADGWRKLGLSAGVIRTIQHYLKAGGHFYKKEDLKKIYGLSSDIYQHLDAYIQIAPLQQAGKKENLSSVNEKTNQFSKNSAVPVSVTIDINQSDSVDWVKLRGIGPVLSSRIIKFRKALGGFYSVGQVAEVYGLPDSVFKSIRRQLKITTTTLKKLNINTATVDELKSHPYINFDLAAAIKAFRDQHGPFKSIEELKRVQLVDDGIYRKLAPYLTVN